MADKPKKTRDQIRAENNQKIGNPGDGAANSPPSKNPPPPDTSAAQDKRDREAYEREVARQKKAGEIT